MIRKSLRSFPPFTVLSANGLNSARRLRMAVAAAACLGWSVAAYGVVTAPTIANNILPAVAVGSSESQTVTLTLTTADAISSIAFKAGSSSEFSIVSISGCTIDGVTTQSIGTTCNVTVSFTPARPGSTVSPALARNATLLFTDSSANVFAFGVSGAATGPIDHVTPGTITDFAGVPFTGTSVSPLDNGLGLMAAGSGGDNSPATSAHFDFWSGLIVEVSANGSQPLAFDGAGNLYVIDAGNFVIRKIAAASPNTITTVAGIAGSQGTTGNGGLATSAKLNTPSAIALDSAGDIYFLDTQTAGYGIVRRIDAATGIITAVAGQNFTGAYNSTGGGACTYTSIYSELAHQCGDGGQASYAWLNNVHSLAIDAAGNFYLWGSVSSYADLRKINAATGVITTVANTAALNTLSAQGGMTLASDGNIYVVVTNSTGSENIIERFNPATSAVTVVGGGAQPIGGNCSATTAQLGYPAASLAIFQPSDAESVDLSSDASGNIYYSGGLCSASGNVTQVTPAVFRINIATDYAYLEINGYGDFSNGTATSNYDAYYSYFIYPYSAIPDNQGNIYFTTYNQIGLLSGSSAALNYASQNDFTTSAVQIASFANVGNAVAPAPATVFASGANFVLNSTGDASACSAQANIAFGAVCDLDIAFAPVAAGPLTDTLNATSAGAHTSVALTGVAVAEPRFSITPANLAFGNHTDATTSSPLPYTLSNPGTASLTVSTLYVSGGNSTDFAVASGGTCSALPITIPAGGSCTVNITFTPPTATSSTAYSSSLYIADTINFGLTSTMSGTGVPASGLPTVTAPSPLVFNPAPVGISLASAQTLTATFQLNGFAAGFTPTAMLHYGLSYRIGTVSCTGTAGSETCSVPVTFQPQYPGGRREALFLMNGTTRLSSTLIYGIGQGPFAMVQPGLVTNPPLSSSFYYYTSIVDENGTVYVLGDNSNTVFTVTKAGAVGTLPITGLNSPRGIGIDGAGVIYIADQTYNGPTITYDTVQGIQGSVPFPVASTYIQTLAVGNTGNIYETNDINVYTLPVSGTGTAATTAINPAITQGSTMTVDSNENVFVGGYTINEITSGGVQTEINTIGAGQGIGVDAAGTVYATRYSTTGSDSVAELPASGYGTALAMLDPTASPLGISVAPDGTVYVGNYTNLDKVDRSQGLIAFGEQNQALGTAGTQQIVTIYNGGNQTLTLSSIAITGAPFSIQTVATGPNCANGSSIAPGALCQIGVVVTPLHAGAFNGSITVTSNSLNTTAATQTIALTAYTYGVYVTASPNPLSFPSQTVNTTSSTQTVTLINNGDLYSASINGGFTSSSPGFTVTAGTCTSELAVGATCQLNVTFTPTLAQPYSSTITFAESSTGGGPNETVSFTVTGTGTPASAPVASLSPNPLAFPSTNVGSTATALPVTLSNTGNAALTGIAISVTGTNPGDFVITPASTCGTTLAAAASCLVYVSFTPASATGFSATLSVADNATGSPQTVTLTGTGTMPQAVLSPNPLAFPSTTVGIAAAPLPMTLSNPGSSALTISSIAVTGTGAASFGQTNNCPASLAAGGACTITVSFTPTSAAALTAAISVADNASGSPQSASITGTGAAPLIPQAVLSPNPLAFPSTTINTPATPLAMTLSNPGNTALAITGIAVTGVNAASFGETSTCGSSLAAGASCTITVSFTPATAGSLSAAITVTDSAAGSPQSAAITGIGSVGTYTVASSTPSQTVQPGAAAQFNIQVNPLGGSFNNLVTLSATGLPAGAQVSFLPPAVTPGSAGAPSVMSIQTSTGLAHLALPKSQRQSPVPLLALLAGIPLLGLAGSLRRLRRTSQRWMLLALAALAILPVLALGGCGGGYFGPAPQTYTVTVTGTSGALQESTTISLTVQ